jgi:hypothetical protein
MGDQTPRAPGRKRASPWQTRVHKSGFIYVRFTVRGHEVDRSTRTRDPEEAQRIAAEIYSTETAGRGRASGTSAGEPLEDVTPAWILEISAGEVDRATANSYASFANQWARFFGTTDRLTMPEIAKYIGTRLGRVLRKSIRKDLSALRGFLDWLVRQGGIDVAPVVPAIPRGKGGVRSNPRRKLTGKVWTREQIEALIAACDEWSQRRARGSDVGRFRVRDYAIVLWETGSDPRRWRCSSVSTSWWSGGRRNSGSPRPSTSSATNVTCL